MNIENEEGILQLIKEDEWMMSIIRSAGTLELKDWCVCAGFVRSKIWDTVHGFEERTVLSDIDVIFYDHHKADESLEKEFEAYLVSVQKGIPWSVKNQARMHLINDLPPYTSTEDAIWKFPETTTALGVSMDKNGELRLIAPHGFQDAVELKIKPTPLFRSTKKLMEIFEKRLVSKNWSSRWPGVKVEIDE